MGILVLEETPEGFLLDNIAILPEGQGKGYGRALIEFAEAEARRRGFAEIRLYTHEMMTENIALYSRIGYAETPARTGADVTVASLGEAVRRISQREASL